MHLIFIALYSYLLGAIPSAYLVGKARGIDITREGSGNIGGTNAYRVLGARIGILVFMMDLGKVILALAVTQTWFNGTLEIFIAAVAAVVGHNWSVYVRFKGGKGIAVTIGTYLFLFPSLALLAIAIAIFNLIITKYVSLASINLVASMAILLFATNADPLFQLLGVLLLIMGVYRHRDNIQRLRSGNERRFGQNTKDKK